MASVVSSVVAREIVIQCSDGIRLAAQSWRRAENEAGNEATQKILCLHGWMDNCRSFHHLAPAIVSGRSDVELVAFDFVGHGLSSHKSADGPPILMAEAVYYVAEVLNQLGWNSSNRDEQKQSSSSITLIGHSMGAAISCFYAAAFPEQIARLLLVEGAGPLHRNHRDIAKHVRAHVHRRLQHNDSVSSGRPKKPRIYPTLEEAVKTRCQTATNFPGNQWLSTEAATELVLRGTERVGIGADASTSSQEDQAEAGFRFRHDPRLQWPSIQYLTWEQTSALYQDISCPTALLLANDGWPFDEAKLKESVGLLQPSMFERLPGSHHFHADPESAEAVAQKAIEFLEQY